MVYMIAIPSLKANLYLIIGVDLVPMDPDSMILLAVLVLMAVMSG